jgi:hypothetical protein
MPMSLFLHFFREFAVCAALSFLITLGAIHALLHLLHIYCVLSLALHMPLATILTEPAVQLALLADAQIYLLVVFKVTVACTVLVFALRELALALGPRMGWCGRSRERDAEAGDTDRKAPVPQELGWRSDEKRVVSRDSGCVSFSFSVVNLTRLPQVSCPDTGS